MTTQPTFEGDPCKNCGSTTRFAKIPRKCVACKKASAKRSNEKHALVYALKKIGKPAKKKPSPDNPQHRRLGVDAAKFTEMLVAQDGKCAVCRKVWKKKLYVDHCHKTNRVRGLLCGPCNTAIGQLGDDLAGVMRAVDYLTRNEEGS